MGRQRRTIFIGLFFILSLAAIFVRSALSGVTFPDILGDGLTFTLGILYESLPFVFLGVLVSVLLQQFVSQKKLLAILPKKLGLQRIVLSLMGSFLPVCECGNVPTARGFMTKGLLPASVMAFLLAAPIINPITILTTSQAFSNEPQIVWLRILGAFIIANFVGWALAKYKQKELITDSFAAYCADVSSHTHAHKRKFKQEIKTFSSKFTQETQLLLPSLVGGSVLAGVIQTAVPRTWLLTLSSEPMIAILTMMLLAFVVSICANVDAFFALALASIFPTSAIIAFLLFGPMIDIKMIALLRTTFTTKAIVHTSILVFALTLTFALGVHYVV